MKIYQFHSGTAFGDAITNQMLSIQQRLIQKGYESLIFADFIDDKLKGDVLPTSQLNLSANDVLIIHHSIKANGFNKIIGLKCKKILIYHNITPAKFFDEEDTRKVINIGIEQIKKYKDYIDYVIADSNYNRKQLLAFGYRNVDVMPVDVALSRFDNIEADKEIVNENKDFHNFIFVGRIVPNKKQEDIIKAFAHYHSHFDNDAQLFLIGDTSNRKYVKQLYDLILDLNIPGKIFMPGKLSEEKLKAYYEVANAFVCMSEHEGFGVPLLEAMKLGVPVIAFKSSAIEETLGGNGILFIDKDYEYISSAMNEVVVNNTLKTELIDNGIKYITNLEKRDSIKVLFKAIKNVLNGQRKRTIQIVGPFETSYSLASVNRLLALELDKLNKNTNNDISIHCKEGTGDYVPLKENVNKYPDAKRLYEKSFDIENPDITIREMYPPKVDDCKGGQNYQLFGWEESYIPRQYILDFNEYLDGVGAMSDYVTELLIENGLTIPVRTIGVGVSLPINFDKLKPYPIESKKSFKFLHISSAFPRKGIKELIVSYFQEFKSTDDVALVLKTFPNIHNNVEEILTTLEKEYPDHPEIVWLNFDLDQNEIYRLYKCADAYVQASKGEGFGLPVAEAMLAKIPTISTNNTGLKDFVNSETSLVVDSVLTKSSSHISSFGSSLSYWFGPSIADLRKNMRFVFENRNSIQIQNIIDKAYLNIKNNFSWESVATRWQDFIDDDSKDKKRPYLSLVTTWNTKCGIAEYSKLKVEYTKPKVDYLIFPNNKDKLLCFDNEIVDKRLWRDASDENINLLVNRLKTSTPNIVEIQFNWSFILLKNLEYLINELSKTKKVIVVFHSTSDCNLNNKTYSLKSIVRSLNKCKAIVVHQIGDKERLVSFGVDETLINHIPLGQIIYPRQSVSSYKEKFGLENKLVFGSYGFLLPHKGILDVIKCMPLLIKEYPNIYYMAVCSLFDNPDSKNYYKEITEFIENNHLKEYVKLIPEYLSNDESLKYLFACDFMVSPYHQSSESASGAIRFLAAARRPMIISTSNIFKEIKPYAYNFECENNDSLYSALKLFIENNEVRDKYTILVEDYLKTNSWRECGSKFIKLYKKLDD